MLTPDAFKPVSVDTLPAPGLRAEQPDHPLYWGYDLGSNIDASEVYANIGAVKLLARVIGVSGVVVRSGTVEETAGQQDTSDPVNITGITGDSAAIGTRSFWQKPEQAARMSRNLQLPPEETRFPDINYEWPLLNVTIDRADTARCIAARRPGVTAEATMAKTLDIALRTSMLEAGRNNLIERARYPGVELTTAAILATISAVCVADFLLASPDFLKNAAISTMIYAMILGGSIIEHKHRTGSFELGCRRFSLFPTTVAPDRYFAANVAAFVLPDLITYKQKS